MSLIPAETERVARAAFPKGSLIMRIADEIGRLMTDRELAQLVPNVGQSALAPGRLLLTDPGFDASVLSASRDRLLAAEQGVAWLEPFLVIGRECGLVQARGKQRTDATHVLGASRTLNRLACLGETLDTTLPHLLWEAPAWTRRTIPRDWWVRYQQRFDHFRLPRTAPKRDALALALGADGRQWLTWIAVATTPAVVRTHPAVRVLRQVWIQQFSADEPPLQLRTAKDLPPAARVIGSPSDPDARLSTKRDTTWTGDKVHLTETGDPDGPNLITAVQTTPATTADVAVTESVHQALAARDLLPAEHVVERAYPDADILVYRHAQGIDLLGPGASGFVLASPSWTGLCSGMFHDQLGRPSWALPAGSAQSGLVAQARYGRERGDPYPG